MSQRELQRTVLDQFRRTLGMLREAILAFPEEAWIQGEIDYLRPAGLAYHVLETIDFYIGDQPADQFPWGGRFGLSWEDPRSEMLPDRKAVIAYLDEVEVGLESWLEGRSLAAPEQAFPWTGPTLLGRAIYLVRNTQHHVAEMSLELTRRGYDAPAWQ